ncbi:MAG: hypothetical protein LBI04_02290 [Treponema sp.]|jgi:hypothetical protein|nr:hypothetical protein [Treponema sp.]
MKKFISLCIVGCFLAISVYAQVNVGGYAKSYWIPYRLTMPEEGDKMHTTAVQVPWGEPDLSAGFGISGWSEWGGFFLGADVAYGASNQVANPLSIKGKGWVWVKPFDFIPTMDTFTIYLGVPNNETLMGKIGGSDLSTYVLDKNKGGRIEVQDPSGNIFTKFNPAPWGASDDDPSKNGYWPRVAAAAMITWEPVDNLFIGAFVAPELFNNKAWKDGQAGYSLPTYDSANGDKFGSDGIDQDYYDAKQVYRKIQFGAGYRFPGIGFARAQFIGARNTAELAFQITAFGDLVFDIGAKIPFEGTDKDETNMWNEGTYKKRKDLQASVAATYKNYDFRLLARVDAAFGGSDSAQPGMPVLQHGLNVVGYLVPSYKLDVGTVGMDLGFQFEQMDDINSYIEDSMMGGAGLWFSRSLGAAEFKMGAISRFPLKWNGKEQPFELFFPILVSAGF